VVAQQRLFQETEIGAYHEKCNIPWNECVTTLVRYTDFIFVWTESLKDSAVIQLKRILLSNLPLPFWLFAYRPTSRLRFNRLKSFINYDDQLRLERKGRGRCDSFGSRRNASVAEKTVRSVDNACHTWVLLRRGCFVKRRYITCHLLASAFVRILLL